MVYKRTLKRRPRTVRRRRPTTRKMVVSRPIRSNVLSVKRTFHLQTWAWSTTATSGFWQYLSYSLSNLPNLSEYQALFDLYKINGIKLTFRPNIDGVNPSDVAAATGGGMGSVHYIIDPQNTFTPTGTWNQTTVNQFMELGNVKTRNMAKPFSIYWKPRIFDQLAGGGSTSRAMSPRFLRLDSPGVTHTGVHVLLHPSNSFATTPTFRVTFDIFATFYLQFKGMK